MSAPVSGIQLSVGHLFLIFRATRHRNLVVPRKEILRVVSASLIHAFITTSSIGKLVMFLISVFSFLDRSVQFTFFQDVF